MLHEVILSAMSTSLFINGAFEETLAEIEKTQHAHPGTVCYLQPYSSNRIKLLAESVPSPGSPITLYLSLTKALNLVSYRAKIVGWQDKRTLGQTALAPLNQHIVDFQPSERDVYLTSNGQACVNLISVVDVTCLETPFSISCLIKTTDGKPLKKRTRAGGWSPVREQIEWLGTITEAVKDDIESALQTEVAKSLADLAAARQQRLATAPRMPESIQVVSRAFRRNPDVIAEVLIRADGTCEHCRSSAPFRRASDDTPYLEVHHRKLLSEGGEDTVVNALALCPNCHRRLHFGRSDTDSPPETV
jgi:hypothetical protein